MLGMKSHFDIGGSIEIREVDIAGVACMNKKVTFRYPDVSAEEYIALNKKKKIHRINLQFVSYDPNYSDIDLDVLPF